MLWKRNKWDGISSFSVFTLLYLSCANISLHPSFFWCWYSGSFVTSTFICKFIYTQIWKIRNICVHLRLHSSSSTSTLFAFPFKYLHVRVNNCIHTDTETHVHSKWSKEDFNNLKPLHYMCPTERKVWSQRRFVPLFLFFLFLFPFCHSHCWHRFCRMIGVHAIFFWGMAERMWRANNLVFPKSGPM